MMASLAPNYLVQQLEQLSLNPETSRNQEEEVVFKGRTGMKSRTNLTQAFSLRGQNRHAPGVIPLLRPAARDKN